VRTLPTRTGHNSSYTGTAATARRAQMRACWYICRLHLCLLHGSKFPLAPYTIAPEAVCIYCPCSIVVVPVCMLHNFVLVLWRDERCNDEILQLDIPGYLSDAVENFFLFSLYSVVHSFTDSKDKNRCALLPSRDTTVLAPVSVIVQSKTCHSLLNQPQRDTTMQRCLPETPYEAPRARTSWSGS
jgi:hypothetical protein